MYQCDEHSYESSSEDDEIVDPEPENMLGCYKDTSSKRVLNLQTNYKLDDMTPEVRLRPLAVIGCFWLLMLLFIVLMFFVVVDVAAVAVVFARQNDTC